MRSVVLARMIRQPLVWLGILALIILTLFALESSASTAPSRVIPFSDMGNNGHSQGNGASVGGGHDNNGDGKPDHCTDGHGQDGTHNPHCRGSSAGQ